jgi:hypothetical protein
MLLSFSFLKTILKDLKHLTFKGYKAWEVCEGKVIISRPNCYAYFIAPRLTCEPCPYKANRRQLLGKIPPRIDLLKNDKKYLNKKLVIHVLVWTTMHVPILQCGM